MQPASRHNIPLSELWMAIYDHAPFYSDLQSIITCMAACRCIPFCMRQCSEIGSLPVLYAIILRLKRIAAPHMGSAYTTIAVDSAARFQRLAGKRVTMVTGTDEHGEKIAAAAAAKGLSPQEHCDRVADEFKQLWVKVIEGMIPFLSDDSGLLAPPCERALLQYWLESSALCWREHGFSLQFSPTLKNHFLIYLS